MIRAEYSLVVTEQLCKGGSGNPGVIVNPATKSCEHWAGIAVLII
jgi:hypothetical protein